MKVSVRGVSSMYEVPSSSRVGLQGSEKAGRKDLPPGRSRRKLYVRSIADRLPSVHTPNGPFPPQKKSDQVASPQSSASALTSIRSPPQSSTASPSGAVSKDAALSVCTCLALGASNALCNEAVEFALTIEAGAASGVFLACGDEAPFACPLVSGGVDEGLSVAGGV